MNNREPPIEAANADHAVEVGVEHGAGGQATPPQLHAPKRILVVDDELCQLKKNHVRNFAADFYDTIEDINDPIFDNLWDVARAVPGLGAADWNHEDAAAYLSSNEAVSSVLLSPAFVGIASESLRQLLAPFTARATWVADLKNVFQNAFQAPEFVLQFEASPRPPFGGVAQCDAVFLDLFLEQGEASPVEMVQIYLRQLATDAGTAMLPPLVLMSSHPELEQYKLGFSEHAGISAAGLMVLPKVGLMEPEFRASGLKLAFKQLDRQKKVAHAMRLFMSSWLAALDQAKSNAARTLWNLDASAMQQIHLASISDNDPYDEHLNELLSREHLFHVEAQADVVLRVAELDKQFRAQLTPEGVIENRLISPMVDIKTARALVSHFAWVGSALPSTTIGNAEDAVERLSRSLPFGSVLGQGQIRQGSKCLIHITQQCDLNSISRDKDTSSRTLSFAMADASELQASSNPIVKTEEFVVKGLQIEQGNDKHEFDLQLDVGSLIAMPPRDFLDKADREGWRVIGRLRSDITSHIVAATTNHMSRPASQKVIRPGLRKSKVFLQSAVLPDRKLAFLDKGAPTAQPTAKVFSVLFDRGSYCFEDNASIEIALWLAFYSTTIVLDLEPDLLAAALRRGWTSPGMLQGGLKVRVRECERLSEAYRGLVGGDVGKSDAQLTVILEA